jgi:hypothetical protein
VKFDSIVQCILGGFSYQKKDNLMGERRKDALRVTFARRVKLKFHGTKVTSDAGLLAYRELDNALGLIEMVESKLVDIRKGV